MVQQLNNLTPLLKEKELAEVAAEVVRLVKAIKDKRLVRVVLLK